MSQLKWRKATHSTNNGGNCVEIAALPEAVAVRDSKNPNAPHLIFSRAAFTAFTTQTKRT